jgi:hypothetical protein
MGICTKWVSAWRIGEAMDTLSHKAERMTINYEGKIPESVALIRHGYEEAIHDMYELIGDENETDIKEVLDLAGCECSAKDGLD